MTFAPEHMAQVAMAICSDSSEAPVDQQYSSLDYIEASIMLQYNNRSWLILVINFFEMYTFFIET